MRLALLIGIVLPFFSQICGINVIIYYGPTVLKAAGLANNAALLWQVLFGVVNIARHRWRPFSRSTSWDASRCC